jgi:hypothetical protein
VSERPIGRAWARAPRRTAFAAVAVAYALAGVAAWGAVAALSGWGALARTPAADVAATMVVFAASTLARNASLYDPYWSVAPPVIAAVWALSGDGDGSAPRSWWRCWRCGACG